MLKKKVKRKNPKDFNSAIIKTINDKIDELKKHDHNYRFDIEQDNIIKDLCKSLIKYFQKYDDFSSNELINQMKHLVGDLKEQTYEYTDFD